MTQTAKQLLIAAKALIADPAHWCQGTYAKNANGQPRVPTEPDACQFCAVGAVHHAANAMTLNGPSGRAITALHSAAFDEFSIGSAPTVNDCRTHADVMKMYDYAIARTA